MNVRLIIENAWNIVKSIIPYVFFLFLCRNVKDKTIQLVLKDMHI